MRSLVAAVPILALLVLASACADLYEVDPAHAARADSSAAGYDVGTPADPAVAIGSAAQDEPATTALPPRPRPDPASRPARDTGARATGARDTVVVARRDSVPRPRDSLTTDSARAGGHGAADIDVATLPASLSAPVDDSIVVNTFFAYNPAARTVWIDLVAGFNAANGSLNFNGGFAGSHRIVVPLGWRVEARFANRDQDLAHSAAVIREIDPIPMLAPPAAFAGAYSIALEDGLTEGRTDSFRFSADREGRYMILCAVPGHGQGGMWVGLEVSGEVKGPEYRR